MQGLPKELKKKRLVRIKEAKEAYSIGETKLREIARNAGAIIRIGSVTLYDLDTIDEYLETFRVPREDYY